LFDAHGVSFVSVTQQFNTTTSMGRLTLNVLLSFAQFEREVTAERIRDKIAASKRKGLWVGGMVPLGYQLKEGKLLIVEDEAEQVRTIFKRYLELGSVNRLVIELRQRNFRSKVRKRSMGGTRGGVAFTQGPLFYMLRNRFYIGEVRYKNEICPGPQPPLIERELFESVQAKLTEQRSHRVTRRTKSAALLRGLLFDEAGHRMIPTHATKHGVRYRYYVSQPYLRGIAKPLTGAIIRVPAAKIEGAVTKAVAELFQNRTRSTIAQESPDQNVISVNVSRVEVRKKQLAVWLKNLGANETEADAARPFDRERDPSFLIPWCKPPAKKSREILLPPSVARQDVRPIKVERRAALLRAIARGHVWLEAVTSGVEIVEDIAARHRCSVRHVNMTISMAFIAPGLVRAAVEGRLPRGIGIANLRDAPAEWSRQYERLGLTQS
jgi:site-specific DNA recombinase